MAKAPAVDEIKVIGNDDKAAKCSFSLCSLVIIIKNFNFINSRRPWPSNLISILAFFLVLGCYFFYTRGVLVEISITRKFVTYNDGYFLAVVVEVTFTSGHLLKASPNTKK